MLYLMIFPIIFSFVYIFGRGVYGAIYLVIPCFLGALTGLGCDNVYFVEGSGAKVLYHLLISRRELALSKALTTVLLTAPIACIASAVMMYIITKDLIATSISAFITLSLNIGTSMLTSAINTKLLPREPSD